MDNRRKAVRHDIDLPVTVSTILECQPARIVDLSEHGARLNGVSIAHGARLEIDYQGQTIFAQSRWSEIDRTGVQFLEALTAGPLFEILQAARKAAAQAQAAASAQAEPLPFALDSKAMAEGIPFSTLRPCRCLRWQYCARHGIQPDCLRLSANAGAGQVATATARGQRDAA